MSATIARQTAEPASGEPRTLWEFIARAMVRFADSPAVALREAEPEVRWSYRELSKQVELVAGRLVARGIGRGDAVMLELPYATFLYRVTGHVIVPSDDVSRLRSRGFETVALQACHPRFFATHRYIAYARPVQVIPRRGVPYLISKTGHLSAEVGGRGPTIRGGKLHVAAP